MDSTRTVDPRRRALRTLLALAVAGAMVPVLAPAAVAGPKPITVPDLARALPPATTPGPTTAPATTAVPTTTTAPATTTTAPPRTTRSTVPVVFLHGFLANVCPGGDASKHVAPLAALLRGEGHTGPSAALAYYACDKGPSIQGSGDPNAYYPSGAWTGSWGTKGGNTNNTDLRHIAYQLAWYLHDTYTVTGRPVSVVGYSMGGLLIRWALAEVEAGNPLFPSRLVVPDVVTISTPHNGVLDDYGNASWCPSGIQCQQMKPGSDFLVALRARGLAPQGSGGTDWTVVGGSSCDLMTAAQSTDVPGAHRVIYSSDEPVCYSHTGYLSDTSTALDVPQERQAKTATVPERVVAEHSLLAVARALLSDRR